MQGSLTVRAAGILAVAGILLGACGGDDVDGERATGEPTSTDAPAATEPGAGGRGDDGAGPTDGVATLMELGGSGVSGEATLRWSADTRALVVTVELVGVEEGVTYAAVVAPDCAPGGGHIYTLGIAVGSPNGTATFTEEITDVEGIDVDGGWAIKVARPPAGPQACGAVTAA